MLLPSPGDTFQGRYELLDILGEGGHARVFRARDGQLSRDVVVKVMTPKGGAYTDSAGRRFLREAAVLAKLSDPHTITLFDYGEADSGLRYMVFAYVAGKDLSHVLADGPLPWSVVVHILRQLLSSLAEAHAAGIIHRDIKPPNVLIHNYDNDPYAAKLLDFGIALTINQDMTRLTQDGAVVGTLRYMSPEQLVGEPIRPASDIYSLGMVAYEMLCGEPAVGGKTHEELARQILSSDPWKLPDAVAPPQVRVIIERMMARTVDWRYVSANDVLGALRALDQPARPAEGVPRAAAQPRAAPPQRRRRERPAAALALVSIIVVAGAALTIWGVRAASERPREAPAPASRPMPSIGGPVAPRSPQPPPPPPPPPLVIDDIEDAADVEDAAAAMRLVPLSEGSPGCGRQPLLRGLGDLRFGPDDDVHADRYDAYVPITYDPEHPHPLLLMLHESGDPPPEFIDYSGFVPLAEQTPFVIIAPFDGDNLTQAWGDTSDAELVRGAILDASNTLCIDTERIFAVGHASGGRMAIRSLCEVGGLAAIATTSYRSSVRGYKNLCFPKKPVPYMHIAGSLDKYSPFEGGKGCGGSVKISVAKKESLWLTRNRCDGKRRSWFQYGNNICDTWDCDVPFVSCRLDGGRSWAGASPRLLPRLIGQNCDGRPADFPFADTIWRFFMQHTRP